MIRVLTIQSFKSIRKAELNCQRVNLFIGGPNTGKSNLLEALGFLGWCAAPQIPLKGFVRFDLVQNLFYDGLVDAEPMELQIEGKHSLRLAGGFRGGRFRFGPRGHDPEALNLDYVGNFSGRCLAETGFIKFYRFQKLEKFESPEVGSLAPPHGQNLVSLILSSRELRQTVADFFMPFELQVVLRPHENAIDLQKQTDNIAVAFPYHLASDALLGIIFHTIAVASNRDATLVFEEPEAHAFPYYTKHLGERIALDKTNQYFIATHNPYLLTAILEKADKQDLAVFLTHYRDHETRFRLLSEGEVVGLLDADPFLSLEGLLEESP